MTLRPSKAHSALAAAALMGMVATPTAFAASAPLCTPQVLASPEMFHCDPGNEALRVELGAAETYQDADARAAFPTRWSQYGFDQRHDPVFPGNAETTGAFWAAPLTGRDMLRALQGVDSFGSPGGWASRTGQLIGEVMGVSVANGIVYSQIGRREVAALDAITGKRIWSYELVNIAGMGQTIVHEVDGRPMVFVPVGDAAYNIYNEIDFVAGQEHDRGASFGALYAFDGLTGELQWRFDVEGAARPAPIYIDGRIHLATGGGELFVLDAESGEQIGVTTNPGGGYPGLASPNWYETPDGRLLIVYGTLRPRLILGMDVTDPANPELAWQMSPPNADANSPGDTPVAVDPELGLVVTTVFSTIDGESHLLAHGIDAATGDLVWSQDLGEGDRPPGYKGSVPMLKDGYTYSGNTINGTYWSLETATGAVRWSTELVAPSDPRPQRPRAAAALYETDAGEDVLIHASGRHIRTLDAATGEILNDFQTGGVFGLFGVAQPAIVGNQLYLAAISGWVFAAPVDFIMSNDGAEGFPEDIPDPDVMAEELNLDRSPAQRVVAQSPRDFLAYAGGQRNNAVVNRGPRDARWQTALHGALPLNAPPLDEFIYGTEIATQMTHWEFGVGSGLAVAKGMVFAGSDRYRIYGLNAETGEIVWSYRTLSRNFGQPVVTPRTVIVGGGDPHFNLGNTGSFRAESPGTQVGSMLQHVTGLDPDTGRKKWTVWTGPGTNDQTPLYYEGVLYWINGQGRLYAIEADTGAPVPPLMDANGNPTVTLDGFNTISSPNLYRITAGNGRGRGNTERALMIVGMTLPRRLVAIDLADGSVVWSQDLAEHDVFINGFAATSVAVDQRGGRLVGTVLTGVDLSEGTANLTAFGLDAETGALLWSRVVGSGAYPDGWVAATPVLSEDGEAFINDPLSNSVLSLDTGDGTPRWSAFVNAPMGKLSWGPGVLVRKGNARRLIQPVGPELYVLDADTGVVQQQRYVGGSFTYQNPVVAGGSLFIGNSWGWVTAMPLDEVAGIRRAQGRRR